VVQSYTNVSEIKLKQNRPDEALQSLKKGYEMSLELESPELIEMTSRTLAEIYVVLDSMEKAEKFYLGYITLSERNGYGAAYVKSLTGLADLLNNIGNPKEALGYAVIAMEQAERMNQTNLMGNLDEVMAIADDVISNEEKINHHSKRADAIVKGMLQHSRSSNGQKELTDINALADEYLRLAYHGLKAKDKIFNADFKTNLDPSLQKVDVIPQDIGRVLLNLINNAFQAVAERKKSESENYVPEVIVSTKLVFPQSGFTSEAKGKNEVRSGAGSSWVFISISDNGPGIPDAIKDKIFQPFFTTKPTGQGTGLGLSLSYDIVKAHGGELRVETKEGEGSTFMLQLPTV
jgi:signal transduction histidine kinase